MGPIRFFLPGAYSMLKPALGISLTSLVTKTYNRMILNRIRPHLDCHLRKNQNGFRSGRTTTSQILALRRLIEGVKDKNLEAILIFIDFKKAFDTIHRGKMLAILKAYVYRRSC